MTPEAVQGPGPEPVQDPEDYQALYNKLREDILALHYHITSFTISDGKCRACMTRWPCDTFLLVGSETPEEIASPEREWRPRANW